MHRESIHDYQYDEYDQEHIYMVPSDFRQTSFRINSLSDIHRPRDSTFIDRPQQIHSFPDNNSNYWHWLGTSAKLYKHNRTNKNTANNNFV